jgi:hypothetical protein
MPTALPGAAERVRWLLEPSARDAPVRDGVVDLLGGGEPEITGGAQRLMFTDLVPAIYERWWRPGLGRIAKGAFGPGMADSASRASAPSAASRRSTCSPSRSARWTT